MRKFINFLLFATFVFVLLQSFEFDGGSKRRRDGTEPGYTGSPGDSFKNCTACHGGFTENVDGWIVSNIPSTGWVPGQRYTITATNTKMGATRFGFEVSPQAYDGTLLGEMIITDTVATKLVGDNKYITYKAAGVDGVDSRSWSFDWIAPDSNISEVGFYGAFNSNPGHKDNDKTFLSVLKVYRAGHKSNIHVSKIDSRLRVYPNPVNSDLTVSFDQIKGSLTSVELYDLNGRLVKTLLSETFVQEGVFNSGFDISDISAGCYILHINSKYYRMYQSVIITGN
ncbi:MAG: choice-of-anchor V domain-containing protein [Chitinophagaceae bacterium]